jgi:hypothetical protein
MVVLVRDPKASTNTIEILTVLVGLLHNQLPDDLWMREEGSSS